MTFIHTKYLLGFFAIGAAYGIWKVERIVDWKIRDHYYDYESFLRKPITPRMNKAKEIVIKAAADMGLSDCGEIDFITDEKSPSHYSASNMFSLLNHNSFIDIINVDRFSDDELYGVACHEHAHRILKHTSKADALDYGMRFGFIGTAFLISCQQLLRWNGYMPAENISKFFKPPRFAISSVFVLGLLDYALRPILNAAFSRYCERQADLLAATKGGKNAAQGMIMINSKGILNNPQDPTKDKWYDKLYNTHPTPEERNNYLKNYE